MLSVSKDNKKKLAVVSTRGCCIATSDILVEQKQPGTLSLNVLLIHSVSTLLQLAKYINQQHFFVMLTENVIQPALSFQRKVFAFVITCQMFEAENLNFWQHDGDDVNHGKTPQYLFHIKVVLKMS